MVVVVGCGGAVVVVRRGADDGLRVRPTPPGDPLLEGATAQADSSTPTSSTAATALRGAQYLRAPRADV